MAKILVIGGGFGGVVAAESLVKTLGSEHEITLVSHSRKFVFYPALVRLAFRQCEPDDVMFDLRDAMLDRRIRFIEGEVARLDPQRRRVTLAGGDVVGELPYDFLVIALGRRLATEKITGFFEHSHHLLSVEATRKFGAAARSFSQGRIVIGSCPGARLPVPVFETAFALSRLLERRGRREQCTITIVSSESLDEMFGGVPMSEALGAAIKSHRLELRADFSVARVTKDAVIAADGGKIECELKMLIPPFSGAGALVGTSITDSEGYVLVESNMRVRDTERAYAVGDCVSFQGPKMGHMAVRQGEVAADNLAAEVEGRALTAIYDHEMMLVIEAGRDQSIFVHKDLWTEEPANIKHSRFWAWAKRWQEQYWKAKHS